MVMLIRILGWILLGVAVLWTLSVYLEIKVRRDVYRILEKISLFSFAFNLL